jgi:hypothetical protein
MLVISLASNFFNILNKKLKASRQIDISPKTKELLEMKKTTH